MSLNSISPERFYDNFLRMKCHGDRLHFIMTISVISNFFKYKIL